MSLEDDSSISEINILPDGRICLFGVSQQVLEALDAIPLGDPALSSRTERLTTAHVQRFAAPSEELPEADRRNRDESKKTVTP